MSDLKLLIIVSSIFYIVYVSIQIYMIEDLDLLKYSVMPELSFEEKRDMLINEAKERAVSELADGSMEGLTPEEQKEEIEHATKEYIKLTVDEEYLEESVDRFVRVVGRLRLFRWLKLSAIQFLAHLYLLLPVLAIISTGSIFVTLVVSTIVMTYYSLMREEFLREAVHSVYGNDIADEVVSSTRVKLSIVGRALLSQSYLFIYIYIILRS